MISKRDKERVERAAKKAGWSHDGPMAPRCYPWDWVWWDGRNVYKASQEEFIYKKVSRLLNVKIGGKRGK